MRRTGNKKRKSPDWLWAAAIGAAQLLAAILCLVLPALLHAAQPTVTFKPKVGKVGNSEPQPETNFVKSKNPDLLDDGGQKNRPPAAKGPLESEAEIHRQKVEEEMARRQAAAQAELNAASQRGSCTGLLCSSAANTADTTQLAAQEMANFAAARRTEAEAARSRIFEAVNRGQAANLYSQSNVATFQRTVKIQPEPDDKQIRTLHRALQDPAFALRVNSRELRKLNETEEQYGHVAQEAHQFGQRIENTAKKGGSAQGAVAGGYRGSAAPKGLGSDLATHDAATRYPDGSAGSKIAEQKVSGAGAGKFDRRYFSDHGLPALPPLAPLPPLGALSDGKAKSPGAGALPGALPTLDANGNPIAATDKSLLAGMLRELQADLSSGGGPSGRGAGLPSQGGALDSGGSAASVGPGGFLNLAKGVFSVPGRAPAGDQKAAADLLDANRSLFLRVKDCLRRKSAMGAGLVP